MALFSQQEKEIHLLSKILLGSQAVFKPDPYRKAMKEAADLVWVSGKCAIIIYMTRGKKSFEQKRDHNHGQMQTWLRRWKNGEVLSGRNEVREFSYSYDDVDHIIGLSIVGGGDVGCAYDADQIDSNKNKLSVCATISDKVFDEIVRHCISVRDVLMVISIIKTYSGRVNEEEIIRKLHHIVEFHADVFRKEFEGAGSDTEDLIDAWKQMRSVMLAIRQPAGNIEVSALLADLSFSDLLWLSIAERSLSRTIALPGQFGRLVAYQTRVSGKYTLISHVGASMKYISQSISEFLPKDPGFVLSSSLEYGPDKPIRILAFNVAFDGPTMTEQAVLALR